MTTKPKTSIKALVAATAIGLAGQAQSAAFLIDDFSQPIQTVTSTLAGGVSPGLQTNTTTLTSGTSLAGTVTRQLGVTAISSPPPASNGAFIEKITSVGGSLSISNDAGVSGTAFVKYTFGPSDFTQSGASNAITMLVNSIDTSAQVDITVGDDVNTASSGFQNFIAAPSTFYELFTGFSPAGVNFQALTSLTLDFKGGNSWDGSFSFLQTDQPPTNVPEPTSLSLLGISLTGMVITRRRKSAKK